MDRERRTRGGTSDPTDADGDPTRADPRVGRGHRAIRPGVVALGVAFGIAAAATFASAGLSSGLEADGVADPDSIIQAIGSLILLVAAAMLATAGLRNGGRRRVGQLTVAAGAASLAIGTALLLVDPSRTMGVVRTDGMTPLQGIGLALLVAGVLAMPSSLKWNRIAAIDAGLVATTVVALTWLAPLRQTDGGAVRPIDIVERHPTAALLLALMTAGALLLVRVAQASRPGDLAIVVAALLIPSAAYCSMIGELSGRTSAPIRVAMMWWLCGPAILALAGFQALRSRPVRSSGHGDATLVDDVRRAARSEWVASVAVVLSLGAVATHRLFIQALDPVMLAVGLITVALSIGRLAVLQQRQMALQRRLGGLAVQLHDRARTDELTGLGNRVALMEELDRCFDDGGTIFAFYADVDDFKCVNDALGHETGDRVLVRTAERLVDTVGPSTFRVGGDEFVALRTDLDRASAGALARTIVQRSTQPVELGDVSMSAPLSIGMASSDQGARTADQLIRDADLALNRAKELGRCRAATFDVSLQERADRRLTVQRGLRDAVDQDGFEVRYRPIVDLESGEVLGAEAMTRWEGPDHQQLGPSEYFEIAADSGLVPMISRSNLQTAAAPWLGAAAPTIPLSISITRRELVNGGLADDLDGLLGDIPRSLLTLQIPESALSDPSAQTTIGHIVERRYSICVRDFGTAASSLRHLTRLPNPSICVDRSFVAGLGRQSSDRVVLGSIVEVGRQLGFEVCADGVARPEQATMLRSLGVVRARGWLFGRPVAWLDFAGLLAVPSGRVAGLAERAPTPVDAEVNG